MRLDVVIHEFHVHIHLHGDEEEELLKKISDLQGKVVTDTKSMKDTVDKSKGES